MGDFKAWLERGARLMMPTKAPVQLKSPNETAIERT
jgi:hypothetical protein